MKENFKKESPLLGLEGSGGGLGFFGGTAADPTYVDDVFRTFLYTGNGGTNNIVNGIDLAGEGGLVWNKDRTYGATHSLWDTERGATKFITTNSTNRELSYSNSLTSFNSNGFSLGSYHIPNRSADYTSWTFRKKPGFFDVVTYSGNGGSAANEQQISHNLGSKPGMIFVKRTDASGSWFVFTDLIDGSYDYAYLEQQGGFTNSGNNVFTDSYFNVGGQINSTGGTYVAYLFANDDQSFGTSGNESIIKCGTYTGNAGTQEIDVGFEPQWMLFKNAEDTSNWIIVDTVRGWRGYSTPGDALSLIANGDSTEPANGGRIYITSTGFAISGESSSSYNASGDKYIYMAIRRPNKPPEAGTEVFKIDSSEGTSPTPPQFTSGFLTDFVIRKQLDGSNLLFATRKQGTYTMNITTSPEGSASALTWDFNDGWSNATSDPPDTDLVAYMFKRAPGFFDVTTYLGTGSNQSIAHNLGVTPELAIVKIRYGNTRQWITWTPNITEGRTLRLNDSTAEDTNYPNCFQANSTFTATNFGVGTNDSTNGSGSRYLALLFASLNGISKVGEYTGTGSNINVDCGFSNGARFVMIKRTDTEINPDPGTDWYVWDTYQGISTGNDPYWTVNQSAAQVTGTDYIDPLNAGFTVPSTAPAALNASGGKYLFLAIA